MYGTSLHFITMNSQSCPKEIAPGFVINNVTELHKHHYAASRVSLSLQQCGHFHKVDVKSRQMFLADPYWLGVTSFGAPRVVQVNKCDAVGGSTPSWLIHSPMYQLTLTSDTTALPQRHKGSLLSPGMPQTL